MHHNNICHYRQNTYRSLLKNFERQNDTVISFERLVVGFKANCLLVGPGPIGGMPSVGVFQRSFERIGNH